MVVQNVLIEKESVGSEVFYFNQEQKQLEWEAMEEELRDADR